VPKDTQYAKYLEELSNYLVDFFRRSQPLFNLDKALAQFEEDFEERWNSRTFVPIGSVGEDALEPAINLSQVERFEDLMKWGGDKLKVELQKNGVKCGGTVEERAQRIWLIRGLTKEEIPPSLLVKGGKKKRGKKVDPTIQIKIIFRFENRINKMGELLAEQIEATGKNVVRKQARTPEEILQEMEEDDILEEYDEEEEDEIRLTKQNYPVGWDGNPIPYWLYRLHGLGQEFKCEICGNTPYYGRRAFETHFREWRHTHGMRCLGLPNSKEFFEITRIQDAIKLGKRLKVLKQKDKFVQDEMVEFEDGEGNVLPKKTYDLLKKQGLLNT